MRRTSKIPSPLDLLIQILDQLNVNGKELKDLKDYCKETHTPQPIIIDFVLTISCILQNLSERNFQLLLDLACSTVFDDLYIPSRFLSRSHLMEQLLEVRAIDDHNFSYIYAWLEVIHCPVYHDDLQNYCKRHGIEEPRWKNLIPDIQPASHQQGNQLYNFAMSFKLFIIIGISHRSPPSTVKGDDIPYRLCRPVATKTSSQTHAIYPSKGMNITVYFMI